MKLALNELKIQSKLLFKALKKQDEIALKRISKWNLKTDVELKLKTCQQVIAKELGLDSWQYLAQILSAQASDNFFDVCDKGIGQIFYHPRCAAFVNQWFSDYSSAKAYYAQERDKYLLPYNSQYTLVNQAYLLTLGFEDQSVLSKLAKTDLVEIYGSEEWDLMVCCILKRRN